MGVIQRLPITIQHTEESLSVAHVHALAGMAGFIANVGRPFDYGVDGSFHPVARRGNRFTETGFPLDFQLKATINWELVDQEIVYDLDADTYNDIVSRSSAETTKLLILLCLPPNSADWHAADQDATTLRNCCYWFLPEGTLTPNTATKRIFIPVENLLTPAVLEELMTEERERRQAQV